MKPKGKHVLAFLAQPSVMILALALADLVWVSVLDSRVDWYFLEYLGYYADTKEALVLVVASVALLFNRTWTSAIAAVFASWTIYIHVFATLRGISNANDISMFGTDAWHHWWLIFKWQPQYALHLTVAFLILVAALLALARQARRSSGHGVEQLVGPLC